VTRRWATLLAASVLLLGTGCQTSTDDEMAPRPTRTITATPSQSVAPAPATVPVGRGEVSPADVVWAQGGVLHVGSDQVDLAPVDIEALAVVRGGVFLLSEGELWFTDLSRLRGTGQTDVTGLRVSDDAGLLEVVDTRGGTSLSQGYDTRTGKAVRGDVETLSPEDHRTGPGRFVVTLSPAGVPSVVEAATGDPVPLSGAPAGFQPGGWAGDSVFYGVGRAGSGPRSVFSCDAVAGKCRRLDQVGPGPVVFGTGR
jgi:hypothetical protein